MMIPTKFKTEKIADNHEQFYFRMKNHQGNLQLKAINHFQNARKKRHVPLVSYYQNKNMLKIDAAAVFSDNMFLRI